MISLNNKFCDHQLSKEEYCIKCGAVSYKNVIYTYIIIYSIFQEITFNHKNYVYPPEISPKTILTHMINNNQKLDEQNFSINTLYIKNRKSIIEIIKLINNALYNSSQTFFLCLYYMDLIFNNNNFDKIFKLFYEDKEDDLTIEINKYDILMISLSCLIIATKYNENDPNVPNIISFINLCSYYSYNKFNYKVSDITRAEVIVLKFLEYKLNYFTIYHYFSFFFTHGFLFENIFEKEIIKKNNYKKDELLEKIYILSREIMNKFVEDNDNIIYILGNNIYYSSIQILIWSTEHILNISFLELFKEEKNIFTLLYKIDL